MVLTRSMIKKKNLKRDVAVVTLKAPTRRLHSSSHSIVRHPVKSMPSQNLILTAPTSATLPAASSPHVTPTALPDLASHVTIGAHLKSDDVSHSDASIATEWNGPHHLFVAGDLSKDGRYQHKYKDFIFDILPSGTSEKICAVVRGHRVGIFPESTLPSLIDCDYTLHYMVETQQEGIQAILDDIDAGIAMWL